MNREAYQQQLANLLPTGQAWPREQGSNLMVLLGVIASEFARAHALADAALLEANPRTTSQMLTDWERVAGLPDDCSSLGDTLPERLEQLVNKVTRRGGQSRAFFQSIAEDLGYQVILEEFRPFIPGISYPGQAIWGAQDVRFYWRVKVTQAKLLYFYCGSSELNERLLDFRAAEDLECILNKLKPAHTILIMAYEGVEG